MRIGRRAFVRRGSLALLALGLPPRFLARTLLARPSEEARGKTVVFVFQRGAVDGLSMVVPFGETRYYELRRSIAIPQPRRGGEDTSIDLDGFFGLHPALEPLHALYVRGQAALVHATGSPHPTRSHFEAQEFMETATPGVQTTPDGWLNRLLARNDPVCRCGPDAGRTLADAAAHAADHALGQAGVTETTWAGGARSPLRGVAVGPTRMPRALSGSHPTLAIPDLERFGVAGGNDPALEAAFRSMYRTEDGDLVSAAAGESFEAIELLRRIDPARYRPAARIEYPPGRFGTSLRQIAQLIKADVGLEVAFTDIGGWDTHLAQGAARGQLALRLRELATGLRAFHEDLGDAMEHVIVVTMSEFGRTAAENGSGGTDHGHGTCMLTLGGPVAGGRVLGDWPGLAPERLYERRDLAITTDFRDVFAEIVSRHLGAERLEAVFPGHPIDPRRWRGVLG